MEDKGHIRSQDYVKGEDQVEVPSRSPDCRILRKGQRFQLWRVKRVLRDGITLITCQRSNLVTTGANQRSLIQTEEPERSATAGDQVGLPPIVTIDQVIFEERRNNYGGNKSGKQ